VSFVFYVDFRLNFKDVDILVFLAFARICRFSNRLAFVEGKGLSVRQ
jgi:hypothetical protein